MNLNRRQLLTALGMTTVAGFAGCGGDNNGANTNSDLNQEENPDTSEEDSDPTISARNIELLEQFSSARGNASGLGSIRGNIWICHNVSSSSWPGNNVFGIETTGDFFYSEGINVDSAPNEDYSVVRNAAPLLSGITIDEDNTLYLSHTDRDNNNYGISEVELGQFLKNTVYATSPSPLQEDDPGVPESFQPPGETTGLTFSDGLWAASRNQNKIWKLDDDYGLDRAVSVPDTCEGLAHNGGKLYASNGDILYIVSASSGDVESSFDLSENISGLTFANGVLWGCERDSGNIYELKTS
jgi:hypothetical protein